MRHSKVIWFALLLSLNLLAGCGNETNDSANTDAQAEAATAQPPVVTQSGAKCGEVPLPRRPLRYCFEDRAGQAQSSSQEVPVIYYFHGLGGSVEDLFEGENQYLFEALKRAYGNQLPIIVSLSLGNEGVMGDEAAEIASAALAQVDRFIAPGKSLRRTLMGGSMGGHNVLRLGAESAGGFRAIAALCPAIGTFNGHDRAEVDAYIARHEPLLDRKFFEKALVSYKRELATKEIWDRNNPLNIIPSGVYLRTPIYISTGIQDQLGFIEGSREFTSRARASGVNVDYHEVTGPHCIFDLSSLLRFLRTNT